MFIATKTVIWIGLGFLGLIILCLALLYINILKVYQRVEESTSEVYRYVDDNWEEFYREFDPQDFITEMDVDNKIEIAERDIRQEFEADLGDIDNIRDSLHQIGRHIQVALEEKHEVTGTMAKLGERFRNI